MTKMGVALQNLFTVPSRHLKSSMRWNWETDQLRNPPNGCLMLKSFPSWALLNAHTPQAGSVLIDPEGQGPNLKGGDAMRRFGKHSTIHPIRSMMLHLWKTPPKMEEASLAFLCIIVYVCLCASHAKFKLTKPACGRIIPNQSNEFGWIMYSWYHHESPASPVKEHGTFKHLRSVPKLCILSNSKSIFSNHPTFLFVDWCIWPQSQLLATGPGLLVDRRGIPQDLPPVRPGLQWV